MATQLTGQRLQSLNYGKLIAAGITASFASILTDPARYDRRLDILVGPIDWEYGIPTDAHTIVPLWGHNEDATIRWTRGDAQEFVRVYHDHPDWRFLARSEQGVMCNLWRDWVEFSEASDDEAERFAMAIGFVHYAEALKLLESSHGQFPQWEQQL